MVNKKRNIENLVRNETVEVAVLGEVTMKPTLSTRKLFDEVRRPLNRGF